RRVHGGLGAGGREVQVVPLGDVEGQGLRGRRRLLGRGLEVPVCFAGLRPGGHHAATLTVLDLELDRYLVGGRGGGGESGGERSGGDDNRCGLHGPTLPDVGDGHKDRAYHWHVKIAV